MTDRQAAGTSGGTAVTGGGREDLGFYVLLLPLALSIGIVNIFSIVDEDNGELPMWKAATWELSSVVVISLLTLLVMALTRRAWPLSAPRWRVALIHVAGMLAFTLAHVVVAGALRWAVYAIMDDWYDPFGPLFRFVYEFRKDALIYVVLVASYVLWRLYVVDGRQAAPALQPVLGGGGQEAIEVRDGARRHFVPLNEIAWIEAAGNYVELHRGHTPILHRAPLSELERQLDAQGFVRIHRSRLVRRAAIEQVESKPSGDYVVRLADGRELQGSRRYRRPLLEP